MNSNPERIDKSDEGSILEVCQRVCTKLEPIDNREKGEEMLFELLCRNFAEMGHKNINFTPHPDSSKLDNLKEHLFLLIDNQEESDRVFEYVYEFLDNVYPEEELWRLKMRSYEG